MRWFHLTSVIPGLTRNLKNVIPGLRSVIPGLRSVIPGLTGNLLAALLAVSLAASCGPEPVDPTPPTPVTPVDPTPAKDTNAPTITVSASTVNVIASPAVTISGSELKIGDQSVASWKDDKSATCTIVLTFTPTEGTAKTLNSWDKVSEAGKLQIKATDEVENSSTADVDLTAVAVYGLESLQNKQLRVDQEVNLLEGVTFAEGLTLAKIEAEQDGIRTVIANPNVFVPEYPGSVDIILTLSKPDGNTLTVNTGNLTVKPLEYSVIVLKTADVINSHYAWFNNIQSQSKKAFVYPHLLTSYITGERYKLDNMEYIVTWEVPKYTTEYENVNTGWLNATPQTHADNSCAHVKEIAAPLSTIKVCGWNWIDLLDYLTLHPDKHFMISCSWDSLGWNTLAQLQGSQKYAALKAILAQKNVIVIVATSNDMKYTLNENEQYIEGGSLTSASVNSSYRNKITVSGFDTDKNNIFRDDHVGGTPLWFWKECNNIVIPFTKLVHRTGGDLTL